MVREFKDMTDQELFDEFKGYYETVSVIGCYGTKDLINKDNLETELSRRGFEIRYTPTAFKFDEDTLKDIILK